MQDEEGNLRSLTTQEIKKESLEKIKEFTRKPWLVHDIKGKTFGQRIVTDVRETFFIMSTLVARTAGKRLKYGSVYDLAKDLEEADDVEEVLKKWKASGLRSKPLKGLKIVIEAAHTPSGTLAKTALEKLGAEIIVLHENVRELSGEHTADPSKDKNLFDVKKELIEKDADFGLAFDLDGDRCAVIYRDAHDEIISMPPDVLMTVMLKFFVEECGYDEKSLKKDRKKGLAVVRDVLGTEGVEKTAETLGIDTYQTDTGYVYLKEKAKQLKADGYIVPMYGESSGHGWLHVTGEIENPITLISLFGVMINKYKKEHSKSENLVDNIVKKNTVIPYKRSGRFDPKFHKEFLEELFRSDKLSDKDQEDIKQSKIPQKVIALGKDRVIRQIQKDFSKGKTINTQLGILKVKKLLTDSKDNMYRYADIRFSLNKEYIGRFVFRASANDPNFVCSFESPYEADEQGNDIDPKKTNNNHSLVGSALMTWLDVNKFSPISDESVEFKNKAIVMPAQQKYAVEFVNIYAQPQKIASERVQKQQDSSY